MQIIFGLLFSLLILSSASGSSSFTIDLNLCNSMLASKTINCSSPVMDSDVFSYDANLNSWIARNLNAVTYLGTFSAALGTNPGGTPVAGDYYLINVGGTINGVSYSTGDWISYNGDDWQKISNSKAVLNVFSRSGNIVAKKADYVLDKLSDVDLTAPFPAGGNVLQYQASGKWKPATVAFTNPPNGSAGGDLTGTYPNPSLANTTVVSGTYKSVTVNAKGRITSGTNPTTFAGYGITDTVLTGVTATLPLSVGGTASDPTVSLSQATTSTNGFLSSTDWQTFNGKQDALASGPVINGIDYPSNATTETLIIPLPPSSATDAVNKSYFDTLNATTFWSSSPGIVYRPSGNVGLGSSTPAFPLTIGDASSTDGSILALSYGTIGTSGTTLTTAGSGKRMFWYAKKAAFRAGEVSADQWDDTNIGNYSSSFGRDNKVTGSSSGAFGNNNLVSSSSAMAVGISNTVKGDYSFAGGKNNQLNCSSCQAFGEDHVLNGPASVAFNKGNRTGQNFSFASGLNTSALGWASATFGYSTTADSYAQTTLGQFNQPLGTENLSSWIAGDPLFVIGNGTSAAAKSNALMILKNGNVGIGVTPPTTTLQVAGTIAPGTDATFDLGTSGLKFKNIYATNSIIQTSDRRFKTDIKESDLGLDFIMKLKPVSFQWKKGVDNEVHYGLLAQETARILKTYKMNDVIVSYDKTTDQYGVRYTELISPLVKAVQNLIARAFSLERKSNSEELRTLRMRAIAAEHESKKLKEYFCRENHTSDLCQ